MVGSSRRLPSVFLGPSATLALRAVLATLKKFCQNAIEVSWLEDETKEKIALEVKRVAFVRDYRKLGRYYKNPADAKRERDDAFDIIEFLDLRNNEVIDAAKTYFHELFYYGEIDEPIEGPDRSRVVVWLARDPQLKAEMLKDIYEKMNDSSDPRDQAFSLKVLNDIRSAGLHEH